MAAVLGAALLPLAACNGGQLVPPPTDPAGKPVAATGAGPDGAPGSTEIDDSDIALKVLDPVATGMTVAGASRLCDDNLALASKIVERIKTVDLRSPAALTWQATIGRLDDAFLSINNASEFPYLVGVAHPDEAVRNAARTCETKTDKLITSIWLDARLAKVIKAFAASKPKLTVERQRYLDHTLRDFRRNGIDLPPAKQTRLRELNKELTELGQRFIAEISSSKGSITIRPEQLAGLPDSYKKAHPPGPKGKIVITTDYPDYYPFVTYARDRNAAKALYVHFVNRGGDANVGRLDRLLKLRHEKAKLLGYGSWADYAIEPRMAKRAGEALAFLDRISQAIQPAVAAELKGFRAEHLRLGGSAHRPMTPPDRYFLTDRLRAKRFKLDSQKLAEYFEIEAVTQGLLDITAAMYGLEYQSVPAEAWHDSVKAYEVRSQGRPIGKFYLDLHARDDKYKHAAMFTIRTGKTLRGGERQTPMAALVCNFPKPGEPMPHTQVVTYFHEFGHVLHHLLTETELASFAGTNTARDFVEVPSQMFEEWAWTREVLDRFARHPQTGAKLPDDLFKAMADSRRFGLALATERQLWLAWLDLAYHTTPPGFDTTKLLEKIHGDHFSFRYVKGTHFQSSFGHLIGYDAGYYGYQWALAMAHDVMGRFRREGLFNTQTAAAWRRITLSRGGAYDERKMVTEFLGRPATEQAYADFLRGK
ncbi:MAG: Zn-dependent oligopeptidase [Deltaproteobacteria bacterium]|nr:Zn-dependent oligopeptidase [Deltaproteobacteria bacterium]